ncbi:response regulator transcription factor [bacterium]|nr:response regulator transcription factor [bacterium]
MASIRVIIGDDQELLRAGLRALLSMIPGIEIVGEADNGIDAIKLAESLKPAIAVLDVMMPRLNGIEAARRIRESDPSIKILIVSVHKTDKIVLRALEAGADGYIPTSASAKELKDAVNALLRGHKFITPELAQAVIEHSTGTRTRKQTAIDQLTTRQREVLQLFAEGYSTKEVAAKLHVSVKTVEKQRLQIMKKLDVNNVVELVHTAIRDGIINLSPMP